LLRDAVLRALLAAEIAGFRAILIHAISDEAKRFYERHGRFPCRSPDGQDWSCRSGADAPV